jgi:hypothetical protein
MVLQALKDRINDDASNYATRWLAELPHIIWGLRTQVSSCDRLLALLSGLRIRSYTSYRRHLRGSTNLVLRGRRGRANTSHRPRQPRRTKTHRCHEASSSRPTVTSLPRSQC